MRCISKGKGEAILFIHGMPTNGMLWSAVIQRLTKNYRCFAIDLPGMGGTPHIAYGPAYLDAVCAQIESVRLEYRVQRWHVVGHDAGAAIASHYAGRFGDRVSCLALLSPAIFPDLKPFFLLNLLRKPLMGEVLAPLIGVAFWRVAMRRALAGTDNPALLGTFQQPFGGPAGSWELMRLVRWGRPEELLAGIPAVLTALPMPALIFHGERDILPTEFAERAAALIPRSKLVLLDSGHFLPVERPDEVAGHLCGFFRANTPSPMAVISRRRLFGRNRRTDQALQKTASSAS